MVTREGLGWSRRQELYRSFEIARRFGGLWPSNRTLRYGATLWQQAAPAKRNDRPGIGFNCPQSRTCQRLSRSKENRGRNIVRIIPFRRPLRQQPAGVVPVPATAHLSGVLPLLKQKKKLRKIFFLSAIFPLHFFATQSPTHIFTMGTGKKEAARRTRQGKTGDGLNNVRTKGENFYR